LSIDDDISFSESVKTDSSAGGAGGAGGADGGRDVVSVSAIFQKIMRFLRVVQYTAERSARNQLYEVTLTDRLVELKETHEILSTEQHSQLEEMRTHLRDLEVELHSLDSELSCCKERLKRVQAL